MPQIRRLRKTHHKACVLYTLVSDINRYHEFLPFCTNSDAQLFQNGDVKGTVFFGIGPVSSHFVTLNRYVQDQKISMELVSGPFSELTGCWLFTQKEQCEISFEMDFEYKSWAIKKVLEPIFNKLAEAMVDAFVARADDLYLKDQK